MKTDDRLVTAERILSERELDAALIEFDRAEAEGANQARCRGGRWLAHMLQGNFEAAWVQSDRIRAQRAPDAHRFWNGESLQGRRVIVRCLHGFGDTVQFFQYAPMLKNIAAHVWWEVPPEMLQIAPCFTATDQVITWGEMSPQELPPWEIQIEVTELPYIFRTQPDDLPLQRNYLELQTDFLHIISGEMGPRRLPRVGVVWRAGEWNPSRSIPAETFAALLSVKGVEWWNLQGGSRRYELPTATGTTLREISACCNGILPLAAVIAQLDLLVTVDTLAVHIAGALGVPALLLLQHAADWRWMHGRAGTPWYPSVQIIREPSPNHWEAVLGEAVRLTSAVAQQAQCCDDTSAISCSN